MEFKHISVLLNESVNALNIKKDGVYADGTLGGGGHSEKILERLSGKGLLIGIDRDIEAIEAAKERLKNYSNVIYENTNFKNIKEILQKNDIKNIDGAVLDLGVSSYQLDNADRGFSYIASSRLDMRMDTSASLDAYKVVNTYSEEELAKIFFEYGEEKFSRRIAAKIVEERAKKPIETTLELSELVKKCIPQKTVKKGSHPAKRVFQAIRIEVNGELDILEGAINDFFDSLKSGGRLAIISFHSLEDRIVKNTFANLARGCVCPKDFPVCVCGQKPRGKIITKKAVVPTEDEIEFNKRSKSSKLRVIEKI
ncbi:MAG: 16S rRNA (cytosine(1402)-N(4))-methyltransferase RsmH [Oscillospiraceae bacterium]|nr:16S rRNA (cytosine(1402)-N(4))-methyltransferase RsmH [Oscillospiraceae bacterium]